MNTNNVMSRMKHHVELLVKKPGLNINRYKILDCCEIYDEMLAYDMDISRSLIDRFDIDVSEIKLSEWCDFSKEEYVQRTKADAHRIIHAITAKTDINSQREAMKSEALAITQSLDCGKGLKYIEVNAVTKQPKTEVTITRDSNDKITDNGIDKLVPENLNAIREYLAAMASPYNVACMMQVSINLELIGKLANFMESAFGVLVLSRTSSTDTVFDTYPLHSPFDHVIYVFGNFSLRYDKITDTSAKLTVMGESKTAIIDVMTATLKLDDTGSIIDSTKFQYCDGSHVSASSQITQDVRDEYALCKVLYDPMMYPSIRSGCGDINRFRHTWNTLNALTDNTVDVATLTTLSGSMIIYLTPILYSFITATLLLTCRHVKTISTPMHVGYAKNKKKKASGGSPLKRIEFSTITISPDVVSYDNDTHTESTRSVAKHIRRGHFKLYTKERPLFGKYSGLVWVPETVVGKDSEASKETDYSVSM